MPDDPSQQTKVIYSLVVDEASRGGTVLLNIGAGFDIGYSFQALYLVDAANQFRRVVSTDTANPLGGTFTRFDAAAVDGDTVYFVAEAAQMLCKVEAPGGPVTVIATKGDLLGTNSFDGFLSVSAAAGGMAFEANIKRNDFSYYRDVIHYAGDVLTSLVGFGTTPMPGAPGSLFYVGETVSPVVLRADEVMFYGEGLPYRNGFYTAPVPGSGKSYRVIVDNTMAVPGLTATFTFPSLLGQHPADLDAGDAVFYATSYDHAGRGLYRNMSGGVVVQVNAGTPVPGGSGNFLPETLATYKLACSGNRMVFVAADENYSYGLFLHDGATLSKILGSGDTLGGVEVYNVEIDANALVGDQLVFRSGGAIWRATLGGTSPSPLKLRVSRNGNTVQVSWDEAAAGPGAILESTESLNPADWQPVLHQSNPYQPSSTAGAPRYFRLKL